MKDSDKQLYAQENLVYNVTEDLLILMDNLEVTKQDLAKKMGKSKSFVSQILDGKRNMTLRTLSDVCFALGVKPKLNLLDQGKKISFNDDEIKLDFGEPTLVSFAYMKSTPLNTVDLNSDEDSVWTQAVG